MSDAISQFLSKAQKNEPHEIQRLIESRIDPSVANGVGQTALHVACLWGNDACVEVLIKAEAEVDAQNSITEATPLHCAAQDATRGDAEGRVRCIQLLLAAGADPDLEDVRDKKPYQYSLNPIVRVMLGGPADPADDPAEAPPPPPGGYRGCTAVPATRSWAL